MKVSKKKENKCTAKENRKLLLYAEDFSSDKIPRIW